MRHDEKPLPSDLPEEELAKELEQLQSSDYVAYCRTLLPRVQGKAVADSQSGTSGFLLHFTDGSWVASYLDAGRLLYELGEGAPPPSVIARLNDAAYGDASQPLAEDLPYSGEPCDNAAEVAMSHGKLVRTLAFGSDCFNFCFPDGMELETMIVPGDQGKPALRIFWEQW